MVDKSRNMWTYKQSTGEILDASMVVVGRGWAGQREGKNNPLFESVPDIGPLPSGKYAIGEPYLNPKTGPYTMDLIPNPSNTMFGRSVFRIHGAAFLHPEFSSEGCIIQIKPVRVAIWTSGDHDLQVIT